MWTKDWAADGLNKVGHSFGVKFGVAESNPFLQKALKDQTKVGNCFGYSMMWARHCRKSGRKPASKMELLATRHAMLAAQAMQSWIVRQNKAGAFGPDGMLGLPYNQAMAAAFSLTATEFKKQPFNPFAEHDWIEAVVNNNGVYVVTFKMLAGGAHAIALLSTGMENVFFDPNFGQYSAACATPWEVPEFTAPLLTGLQKAYKDISCYFVSAIAS
jgi:hypothetical protein